MDSQCTSISASRLPRISPALLLTVIAGMVLLPPAHAELPLPTPALDDAVLDTQRGGFLLDNLEISIGLEQVVSVNGETLVVNRLMIPNLNQALSPSQAQIKHNLETFVVVPGSQHEQSTLVATNRTLNSGWLTQIQNNLDGAVIQNIRALNIELNNVGTFQRMPETFGDPFLQSPGR
ncbi:hypothetical protein [Marinobacter caseinilyticus]|uniref:hypothetical protein n=1 Tax=Marinobacter caseinilyticus TaxID=2692195 RepID=UPI00140787C7|nr:hypothetical protein [Marinobacter caseinilyticus]